MYAYENIPFFQEDSGNIIFPFNEMSILNIDINNINLDNNFIQDNPNSVILVRRLAWHIEF